MVSMVYDMTTVTLVFTFIGVLVIGAAKYYERKIEGSTEPWNNAKFGLFVLVAAGVMLFEYIYVGNMQFPADEVIGSILTLATPIASLFGLTYTIILGGKYVKNGVVIPVIANIQSGAAPKPTGTPAAFAMGYTVTPTYKEGKSPLPVPFKIYATQPQPDHPGVVSVDIDWADGFTQNVPLINGEATVSHIFAFITTPKYTGHTFYPIFTFIGNDGSRTVFNLDGRGVEIWVQA